MAPGAVEPERLPLLTEAVACLALNREGLHPRVLASMIWPLGVTGDVVTASIERLRIWLGDDETRAARLREDEEGRLVPGRVAVTRWRTFRTLTTPTCFSFALVWVATHVTATSHAPKV